MQLTLQIAQHFHLADQILLLEGGKITEQRSWDELKSKQDQIEKVLVNNPKGSAEDNHPPPLIAKPQTQVKPPLTKKDMSRLAGDSALYGMCRASNN